MTILANLNPAQQAELTAAVTAAGGDGVARLGSPLQNVTPGCFNRYLAARAAVRAGTGGGLIGFTGTSLMLGFAAGDATNNLVRPRAPNVRVADALNRMGIPASSQGFMGNGFADATSATMQFYDNRITVSGGWAPASTVGMSAGGFFARSQAAGTLSFAFTGAVDRLNIYEVQTNGYTAGTYSVDIDGTTVISATESTTNNANNILKKIRSFTAVGSGAHVLNINWISGGVGILGVELYSSTSPTIRCLNMGIGASTSTQWASTLLPGPTNTVALTVNPDLIIDENAANDWLNGVPLDTYTANTTTRLSKFQTGSPQCDVIGMTPFPSANAPAGGFSQFAPRATQQLYVDAYIGVCVSLGIPYIDAWRKIGSWESMNILGKPVFVNDGVHPNSRGAWKYPDLIAAALASIV